MYWLDDSDALKIQRKLELAQLLEHPRQIVLAKTPQRDMSILPVDPPLTLGLLLDLMKSFMTKRRVSLELMDSGEEAFVFKFVEIESIEGELIELYVKAKFGSGRRTLVIFSVHPDRRW